MHREMKGKSLCLVNAESRMNNNFWMEGYNLFEFPN